MKNIKPSLLRRAGGLLRQPQLARVQRRMRIFALTVTVSQAFALCSSADMVTQPLREFGLGDLQQVAISPDRQWMVTSGSGGAFIWEYQTGTMLHRLEAHHRRVLALCFSPSGQVLLTGGGDAVIRAWEPGSGTELRSFAGHVGEIFDLAFAPDGQSFVSVGDDTARVWSFSSGELLHTFAVPGGGIVTARFAPDGHRLVTSHLSFTNVADGIRVWDLATGQTIRSFGNSFVQRFEFVAGAQLVTAGANQVVEVWNIETGELIRPLPGTTPAEFAIQNFLTATNSSLVTAGCFNGRVITWDASTGQILHDFTGERIFSLAAVPGTNQILTAHGADKLVRVRDGQIGTTLRTIAGHTAGANQAVGFSPDGRSVVAAGDEVFIRLWTRTNAQPVRTLAGYPGGTATARFSPDGSRILTTFGAPNYSARLLNAETGAIEREFVGHSAWLMAAVFSSDGQRIATAAQDGTARLWNVATGTQIRTFSSPGLWITAVAVSSNGMMLASGASDGSVRLWDTANGQLLRSVQSEFDAGSVTSLDFSPAGELLVAWANGVLQTFDPTTGASKLDPIFSAGFLNAAVFSPDGRFILDAEGWPSFSARLWDARNGEELRVFAGHAGEVKSVAFNAAGTSILTGADIVRLWSMADIAARLESERKPNGLELRWRVGSLQQSAHVNGPWLDVSNALSPRLIPTNQPPAFFRVKVTNE